MNSKLAPFKQLKAEHQIFKFGLNFYSRVFKASLNIIMAVSVGICFLVQVAFPEETWVWFLPFFPLLRGFVDYWRTRKIYNHIARMDKIFETIETHMNEKLVVPEFPKQKQDLIFLEWLKKNQINLNNELEFSSKFFNKVLIAHNLLLAETSNVLNINPH